MSFRSFALLTALLSASTSTQADDFVPLFKGDGLGDFELVKVAPETLSYKDGEIRMTGTSNGYFATKQSYKSYTMKFDFMYERPEGLTDDSKFPGNSGFLFNIETPHAVWPKCIEFQLMNREVGKIYPMKGAKFDGTWDEAAYKKAIKPVGQWNTMEVTSKDGTVACSLNGTQVATGKSPVPDHGPFGRQTEGAPMRFKNLLVKTLD